MIKISKLSNRLLFLSPTVQAGWESESYRTDFQNVGTLGQGSHGLVWKAKHKKTGMIYAIKQIKKKSINSPKMIEHVRAQVKILYLFNHPNIIKLYNHFEDEFSILFVLQFAERGELYKIMRDTKTKCFPQSVAAEYVQQIVQALQYIHEHNVIHRDIKPENILVDKDGVLKLADFGWSNFVKNKQTKRETYCGTLDYLAPEMVEESHQHDYRVDIWSIGVLIFELCTGLSPFSHELVQQNIISEQAVKKNIASVNFSFPQHLSADCKDLIRRILVKEPQNRLSLAEIMKHSWIVKHNVQRSQGHKQDSSLRSEFAIVQESKQPEVKKYEIFSKEQIYQCSRLESVINMRQKDIGQEARERKYRELELQFKELELVNRRNNEELAQLRTIKDLHSKCELTINELKTTVKMQARKLQLLNSRLIEKDEYISSLDSK